LQLMGLQTKDWARAERLCGAETTHNCLDDCETFEFAGLANDQPSR
jgi:hypothetical protein